MSCTEVEIELTDDSLKNLGRIMEERLHSICKYPESISRFKHGDYQTMATSIGEAIMNDIILDAIHAAISSAEYGPIGVGELPPK